MARRKNQANGSASQSAVNDPKHNVGKNLELRRNSAREMLAIKAERKKLNERAAEIREQLSEAQINVKGFMRGIELYEMEGEGRSAYLESLHLTCESLGVGEQVDFLKVMAEHDANEEAAPTREQANADGVQAGFDGKGAGDIPDQFNDGGDLAEAWETGRVSAMKQRAARMGAEGEPETVDAA